MSVSILLRKEKITSDHSTIIGVYSSQLKAWEIFAQRLAKRMAPYTSGTFRYNSAAMFQNALNAGNPNANSISIYQHDLFEIFIVWNVLDRPLI